MNEADYKRRLVKAVKTLPGGWARRIEDRYAVGVLDLVIKLPESPVFFAEGKIIDGLKFGPTEAQWEEGNRLKDANIRPLLIGWKSGNMYISTAWVKKADITLGCYFKHEMTHLDCLRSFVKEFGPHY